MWHHTGSDYSLVQHVATIGMRKHDEKHILWRFEMAWAFLYQMEIPLCLVIRLAGGAACFAYFVFTAVPPLALGSLQAVQQPLGTSSGVWLVYLSHVLTCICLQHVVGVCPWCHCCSSPLGIGFPSGNQLGTSSGVWLFYLSHVSACIWMQHLVGVHLCCHCCSSPLGSGNCSGGRTSCWY